MKDVEVASKKPESRIVYLTDMEISVLQELANGLTIKGTAAKLGISHRTVEVHRYNILKKTEAKKIIEVIIACYKKGIVV